MHLAVRSGSRARLGDGREARSASRRPWATIALVTSLLVLLVFASAAQGAGELDPTFDGDGRVLTDFGAFDSGEGIALQADGKIVAVGPSIGAESDFALARYNANGSLDPTFDGDGRVLTDFGASEEALGVAIQADGKIVAAGWTSAGENPDNFALARYNADGGLDPTFDGDGRVLTDLGADEDAHDVAIQADGKIVAAGRSGGDFGLARYDSGGSLDPTFGGDGSIVTDFGATDEANAVALQADGKIVAAGHSGDLVPSLNFVLARYRPDGSLDATFDGDGRVVTDFGTPDIAYDIALQADGKIVAAGTSFDASFTPDNFALARYHADGSLDPTFDGDGRVVTDFGTAGEGAFGVAIQADSKIVAAGLGDVLGNENFALARYNPNGSLDPIFDGDGRVSTDFGAAEEAFGVAIQADGKIVAVGSSGAGANPWNFALARYLPDGPTQPQISVNDVARLEGNAGLTTFEFTVSLSNPSSQTITVSRQTQDGTATTADSDYTALPAATITFNPNETQKQVTVNAMGDTKIEPNESFFVNLSGASNATIADGQGQGTIQNDDLSASQPCTITGTSGSDVLTGTAGDDVICAREGDDRVSGLGGRDVLIGGSGKDLLVGGADPDLLLGGAGYDDLRGESGNDALRGGEGGDSLLLGGSGSDALFGENGLDTLNSRDGVSGNDRADGGSASDKCTFDTGDVLVNCP
jgi:uncharacterized delta-60 repeat protein